MNTGNTDVLIAGVGGQGTVLAARLLGLAAMEAGLCVRGSETIGMAQRGGSVISHVRMGIDISSPLIGEGCADVVIAFEPGEAARSVPYLKDHGIMVASDRAVMPTARSGYDPKATLEWLRGNIANLLVVPGDDIIARCGARGLNVALLGVVCATGCLPFGAAELEAAIRARLPGKLVDANLAALAYGEEAARQK
jgi:indolepyruvate ferredoxin oxidoreductase beta subunit